MKPPSLTLPLLAAAAALALAPLLPPTASAAAESAPRTDTAAAVPAVPPPAPTVPAHIPFGDRVAGRHLLFDLRDACQTTPFVTFSAKWTVLETNGPGAPPTRRHGAESLRRRSDGAGREVFDLQAEMADDRSDGGGERVIRHVFSSEGGDEVTATRFRERLRASGNKPAEPTREVFRFGREEGEPLARVLERAQVEPLTRAVQLAVSLAPPLLRGTGAAETALWQEPATVRVGGVSDAVVVDEVEEPAGDHSTRRWRARRYVFAPGSSAAHLLRYEEWQFQQGNPRPARGNRPADDGLRTLYRREEYETVGGDAAAMQALAHPPAVPSNYVSIPPPPEGRGQSATPPPNPDLFAPKALALLDRWRRAQERYLSLKGEVDAAYEQTERTDVSRPIRGGPQTRRYEYLVTLEKPNRAHIQLDTLEGGQRMRRRRGGAGGGPTTQVAVSDGSQARTLSDGVDVRSAALRANGDDSLDAVRRAGLFDPLDALMFFCAPPPTRLENYDRVTYDGPATLDDGEPVEVVTLLRTRDRQQRGRSTGDAETHFALRIWFGRDGLPRQVTNQTKTDVAHLYVGDLPPVVTLTFRFRNVALDTEPASDAFRLPTAPAAAP